MILRPFQRAKAALLGAIAHIPGAEKFFNKDVAKTPVTYTEVLANLHEVMHRVALRESLREATRPNRAIRRRLAHRARRREMQERSRRVNWGLL